MSVAHSLERGDRALREWSSGSVKFTFTDGYEEVYVAGDAYHAPPGHTPTLYAGTEVVEFSPTEPLQQTLEVVGRNVEVVEATTA